MLAHWRAMAGYNAWANRRLYGAVAGLTPAELGADRGLFFRSVLGTLNHILVTDRIWMCRLGGSGEAPKALDAILHEDFPGLEAARVAEDARIVAFLDGSTEETLAATIRYRRATTPEVFEQAPAPALAHLFNHQTHHRGQVHAALTGLGREAPALDLLYHQRETQARPPA